MGASWPHLKLESSSATRLGCRATYLAAHTLRDVFSLQGVLPNVRDRHGMRNVAGLDFVAEQAPDDVVVDRQAVLGKHGVADLLELLHDLVVHAGVVVIRPPQQHHAQAVFALQFLQRLARPAAHDRVVHLFQGAETVLHGPMILPRGNSPNTSLNSSEKYAPAALLRVVTGSNDSQGLPRLRSRRRERPAPVFPIDVWYNRRRNPFLAEPDEHCQMKILDFQCEKVHGYLTFKLTFNSDLTFITGINGRSEEHTSEL